jgi:uncharacterized membrane protein
MKNWRVECEEQIMVVSQYVVAARSKAEARQTVLKQRREMIIDKPKECRGEENHIYQTIFPK